MSNKQPPAYEPTPAYEPPALTAIGTIEELTLQGGPMGPMEHTS